MTHLDPAADRLQPRLKLRLAWLALLWERLWPALWPALFVLGLLGLAALFDLLPLLPVWAHLAVLALFALALAGAAWLGFRRFRLPDRLAARRRLEQASGLAHRPLTALSDRPAGVLSAEGEALWQAHRARLAAELARLKVGAPRAGLAARDPQGLRAALLLLLVIGVVVAGGEAPERLRRALLPSLAAAPLPPPSLDVWVTPPAYTGAAPIFLTTASPAGPGAMPGGATPGGTTPGGTGLGPIAVPEGSTVLAQLQGGSGVPELIADERPSPFKEIDPGTYRVEARIVLGDHLIVRQGGATLADWRLSVTPDQPPTVELAKPPDATSRAVLRLEYKATDDYGIAKVTAIIRRADGRDGPGAGAIQLDLPLPAPSPRSAQAASYHDLTAHPWAGLPVLLRLQARDGSGQTGSSKPLKVVLPERSFANPVARAIIEQRKHLTLAPEDRLPVAEGLYRVAAHPETYGEDPVVTLGLRVAERRLLESDGADVVPEVQALLWDLALRLEEGSLSAAMRELRAAQQALEDALQRGASDAEIQRLMDRLQQAMNQYLDQLQQQARTGKPVPQPGQNQNVSRDDLQRMLDQARDLARSGARDAARQMLSQLQDMLENLRAQQQAGQQQNGAASQAMQMMRDLDSLSRRQQQLLDQSFKDSQRQQMGEQPNTQPGAADQQKLRQQLGELMRRFGEMAGNVPGSLGAAEQAMREAEQALGQGDARGAVDPQSRALDALQKGAQAMADSLMRQLGQQRPGMGNDQVGQNRDPLGRGDTGTGMIDTGDVKIPEQADLQRAREILDELRRRSAERMRPRPERDYIERLLQRF